MVSETKQIEKKILTVQRGGGRVGVAEDVFACLWGGGADVAKDASACIRTCWRGWGRVGMAGDAFACLRAC